MRVEVVRSAKRRKTVELKPIADGVRISIPASATQEEEERYVRTLLRRYEKRKKADSIDLPRRAARLANDYGLPVPVEIRWVDNQQSRWGSCTPSTGVIRISSNVAKFPRWVLDYVIVHELAHLRVSGHGPAFWTYVNRYPLSERARGFLLAKGAAGEEDAENVDENVDEMDDLQHSQPDETREQA